MGDPSGDNPTGSDRGDPHARTVEDPITELLADAKDDTAGSAPDFRADRARASIRERLFGIASEPKRLGRYVVLELIGTGAMGAVYLAYDPDLDRRVALKLLRTDLGQSTSETRRLRLVREAKAMAKLAHPNVVTVYDVGVIDEEVFVAMEYVDGTNLQQWLDGERRPVAAVIDKFVQAGRGLAAAHGVGFIHRDFKPDNVLLRKTGRAQVTDFGLVRAMDDDSEEASPRGADVSSSASFDDSAQVTRTGAILGTPRYMAPEQYTGQPTNPRTDQFSFCVALYQALYGEPPFKGQTFHELSLEVTHGRIGQATTARVPPWLRRIVMRGLSTDPEQRYPSMDALLVDLERDPHKKTRLLLTVAGFAALAGLATFALIRGGGDSPANQMCTKSDARLAGVWTKQQQANAQTAFRNTKRDYAKHTFAKVRSLVDAQREQIADMSKEACEATHVLGTQSSELLDLRGRCLDRQVADLKALTELFARADGKVVDKAIQAALDLPSLSLCSDADALRAAVPPPGNAALRETVDTLTTRRAELQALLNTGKYKLGLPLAKKLATQTANVEYAPIRAEVFLLLGQFQRRSGVHNKARGTFERAALAAAEARDDTRVATAWIDTMWVVGYLAAKHDAALALEAVAKAALVRAGNPPMLRARMLNTLGAIYHQKGKYPKAQSYYRDAASVIKRAKGEGHPYYASMLSNQGEVLRRMDKLDESRTFQLRALKTRQRTLGADHPEVGLALLNLGNVDAMTGDYAAAIKHMEKALGILERANGKDHPFVALIVNNLSFVYGRLGKWKRAQQYAERSLAKFKTRTALPLEATRALRNLGEALQKQGKFDEARVQYAKALAIRRRLLKPSHNLIADALLDLGQLAEAEKKYPEARRYTQQALDGFIKAVGREHTDTAWALNNLGVIAQRTGQYQRALTYHRQALQIRTKLFKGDHVDVAHSLAGITEALLDLGRDKQALTPAERALVLRQKHKAPAGLLGQARYLLARALWKTNKDRKRALKLANQAKADYAKADVAAPFIDAWLKGKQ